LPTLYNLDTFLQFGNPDDGLRDLVMIKASSDVFASLLVDYAANKVVNAPVAASSWYPTLTCGSSKLVLFSGHTPGNRCDQRAKPEEINADLDLPPSLQEKIRAVQQLSSGKAPGSDAIPADIYKHGGPQLMNRLTVLFQEM
uniref:COesterase domain-containing protein n=1 Tax=Schistocephalus solidus TaxID=70667 RepID=A0A183TCB5_SCHSO